jgi:CBS domain-containing protein
MVSNPLWRGNLDAWEKQLLEWRDILAWEQVRYLMIAADLRHICGDAKLTDGLRKTMKRIMEADQGGERDVVTAILRNTVRHKAALNVLGQVITEQSGEHAGEFDVKYGLYIPIVNAVRYLALQYGIEASNTWERIAQLLQLEAVPTRWLESCSRAFNTAVKLRSLVSPVIEDGLLTGSHYLPQEMLKQKELRRELRESLSTVKVMYRTLQRQHRYAERKWL